MDDSPNQDAPPAAAPEDRSRRPILVTGSTRSGSTWVGRMLSAAPHTIYFHEPFNPNNRMPTVWVRFETFTEYVAEHNAATHGPGFERTLSLHYSWRRHLEQNPHLRGAIGGAARWLQWSSYRWRRFRPIMKDPLALFSSEWLASRFGMLVIVTIRNPAAFAGSIKAKEWHYDFKRLLEQEELVQTYLAPFEDELRDITRREYDLVDQAILQWRIRHHFIHEMRGRHPEWHFVRHEDLFADPHAGFRELFEFAALPFTESAARRIREARERHANYDTSSPAGRRAAAGQEVSLDSWRRRLSDAEVERVRVGTADVASHFYADADW